VIGGDEQKDAGSRMVTARRSISGDDQKDEESGRGERKQRNYHEEVD
jgi:hypothetical protein